MSVTRYCGHCFSWTQKFLDAVHDYNRKNKKCLWPAKAYCIACALQHKYTLEKKKEITLDHETLNVFYVSSRRLKIYLTLFEQAGILNFSYKMGAAPKITLLSAPPSYVQNNSTKEIKNKRIIDKRNLYQTDEVTSTKLTRSPIPNRLGNLYQTDEVEKSHIERKEGLGKRIGKKEGLEGRIGRKDRKEGLEGRVGKKGGK